MLIEVVVLIAVEDDVGNVVIIVTWRTGPEVLRAMTCSMLRSGLIRFIKPSLAVKAMLLNVVQPTQR